MEEFLAKLMQVVQGRWQATETPTYTTFTATAGWVGERRFPPPPPVFVDVDEYWWQSVSHWGPVVQTGILVANPGWFLVGRSWH